MQTNSQYSNVMKATTLQKIVHIGDVKNGPRHCPVFCEIRVENGRLSITGVEGPKANGDCVGSCGQIDMHLRKEQGSIALANGWSRETLAQFFEVWERWHLNDMRAGSRVQEDYLRNNPIPESEYAYPKSHYDVASQKLAAIGLNPDPEGYKYGHAWKFEALPDDVVAFLASLPNTDIQPAWV